MAIAYKLNASITADQFIDVLERSTLAERRPVHDRACIQAMLAGADLVITAWDGDTLVGIARSLTDFVYACYLSDLAVDVLYQRSGIGRELVAQTRASLGPRAMIVLLAAPAAAGYYGKIGFNHHDRCWTLAGPDR